jgi:hypothetical protein
MIELGKRMDTSCGSAQERSNIANNFNGNGVDQWI